ncbi:Aldo/keto reductase [Lentinula boryana]|uniref:Aldo/keto reductase n=1 Tax=Lentinula boryana TaxID=40481 RepID=A0ABQ8Q5Q9_9AGAR|nr:Aldo/keto reductase [Lentinula boryana]
MSLTNALKIEYRQLGRSGLRVSVPILGAMSIGDPNWNGWPLGEEQALPLLKHAWDRGVNTWDTANVYSKKHIIFTNPPEGIIGKAIKKYNIPRERLIVLTKCYFLTHEESSANTFAMGYLKNTRDYVNQSGLSRQAIFNQVDASLKRLGTDYIDLLQIHRFDANTSVEETMEALHDLVRMGKVRYLGASSMWTWQFQMMNNVAEKNGWTKFISMQNRMSLLYREEEREMLAYCNFAGIGVIPWGPLHAGYLARPLGTATPRNEALKGTGFDRVLTSTDKAIVGRVAEIAEHKKWSMAQVALAWILTKVSSPIVGMNKPERVDEAIIGDKRLSSNEIAYLEELYRPLNVVGH